MEVAGVVLSSVPIILYALDNYKRGLQPIKDWSDWRDTIQFIIDNVILQQEHLNTTLHNIGIRKNPADAGPTMAEVEAILMLRRPDRCDYFMSILKQMNGLMEGLLDKLEIARERKPTWTDEAPERVSWEWKRVKRSFGSKRRKQIFDQLHQWNVALQNCGLERREVEHDSANHFVNHVRSQFRDDTCTAIRTAASALHRALKSSLCCTCSESHLGNLELDWYKVEHSGLSPTFTIAVSSTPSQTLQASQNGSRWTALLTRMEDTVLIKTASGQANNSAPPIPPIPSSVSASSSKKSNSLSIRSKTRRVVSFFRLDDHVSSGNTSTSRLSQTSSQVLLSTLPPASQPPELNPSINLCATLKTQQTSTSGLGWIEVPGSTTKIHLRHACSALNSRTLTEATNVDCLLLQKHSSLRSAKLFSTRKQRFRYAAALVWGVLHLHGTDWYDKFLRSDNINLFVEVSLGVSKLSAFPFISHTFMSQSTTLPSSAVAGDVQYHNSQIQNTLLFTLAIRLIELGLNKPFSRLRAVYQFTVELDRAAGPASLASSGAIDDFDIAKALITDLASDAGSTYADATDRCLRFLFPGPEHLNKFSEPSFRLKFFEEVVAPLRALYEMMPDL